MESSAPDTSCCRCCVTLLSTTLALPRCSTLTTSTPSPQVLNLSFQVMSRSSHASVHTVAGMPRSWCIAPSALASASAATFLRTPQAHHFTKWVSTTSSAVQTMKVAAIKFSSRATRRPACTLAPSSKVASAKSAWTASVRNLHKHPTAFRATRTHVSCRTSGSSLPCRWVLARSTPFIRHVLTAISITAA